MANFKALDEVFGATLKLPRRGGKGFWEIPEGDSETGLWCVRLFNAAYNVANGDPVTDQEMPAALRFEGDQEEGLQRRLLTPEILDAMKAEGYGLATINFYTQTVLLWHAAGQELAELYWNAGGRPEDFLPAANRAARRAAAKATGSTSTGGASTTPPPVSTNGTKSPKRPKA